MDASCSEPTVTKSAGLEAPKVGSSKSDDDHVAAAAAVAFGESSSSSEMVVLRLLAVMKLHTLDRRDGSASAEKHAEEAAEGLRSARVLL
jgi:hypothetical protein